MRQRFVYLFRVGSVYKIGLSVSPAARLAILVRKDTDAECVHQFPSEQASQVEKALHLRFLPRRIGGEWFVLDADDVSLIRSVERADSVADLPASLRPVADRMPRAALSRQQAAGIGLLTPGPRVVFHLEDELLEALDKYCARQRIRPGRSEVLRLALREFLEREGQPVVYRREG